jgi:hypothetical protein
MKRRCAPPYVSHCSTTRTRAVYSFARCACAFVTAGASKRTKHQNLTQDGGLTMKIAKRFHCWYGAVSRSPDIRIKYGSNLTRGRARPQTCSMIIQQRTDEQLQQEAEARVLKAGIPPIELPEPVQITARAGDLILFITALHMPLPPNSFAVCALALSFTASAGTSIGTLLTKLCVSRGFTGKFKLCRLPLIASVSHHCIWRRTRNQDKRSDAQMRIALWSYCNVLPTSLPSGGLWCRNTRCGRR